MNTQTSATTPPSSDAAAATLRTGRPRLYVAVVVLAIAVAFVAKYRVDGIFACRGDGYGTDDYLAYCESGSYGDYDHGALWFGLEPAALQHAANAAVLFLGSSRLQFALSTQVTDEFFAGARAPYFLLGLTYTENTQFVRQLLQKLEPQARVYVINVDRFFNTRETQAESAVLHDTGALDRYRAKQRWQAPHRLLCGSIPTLCGGHAGFYRSRVTGSWQLRGSEDFFGSTSTYDSAKEDAEDWPVYIRLAREFVAALPVAHDCVLLTLVPNQATKRGEASAIADALGLSLISPRVEDLLTFDGSHLDPASAERWSRAFFDAAAPAISRCLQ